VLQIDEFCRVVKNGRSVASVLQSQNDWTGPTHLQPKTVSGAASLVILGTSGAYFRALDKQYGDYRAVSEETYAHPKQLYSEYDAEEVAASRSFGLLRYGFSKADVRYAQ